MIFRLGKSDREMQEYFDICKQEFVRSLVEDIENNNYRAALRDTRMYQARIRKIAAGTITGSQIATGTITAERIRVLPELSGYSPGPNDIPQVCSEIEKDSAVRETLVGDGPTVDYDITGTTW